MNRLLLLLVVGAVLNGLMAKASAVILPPTDDTSGTLTYNTAKPPVVTKRSLTTLNGTGTTLPVSRTRTAFVRFEVEGTGLTAGLVEKARLTLYFPSVTKVGDLSLHVVTQEWEETFIGPTRQQPGMGAAFLTIPAGSVVKKQFVIVDVTQQVKDWLTNPGSNFGIAITSPDGLAVVTVGSKEGSASGYPPLLEIEGTGASSANTPNTIVKRDGDGNFIVGTVTGALIGNATSATNFTGELAGDVTGTQSATVAGAIGGVSAANVASGANLANAATAANTANAIVRRDGNGNFTAGTVTAVLNGNATTAGTATNFTGLLVGDVTGTQATTLVGAVGGVSASNLANGANLANQATPANTANAIVRRDADGNFNVGVVTGSLVGNAATAGSATNFTGMLSGDVTGTQSATVVSNAAITSQKIALGAVGNTHLVNSGVTITTGTGLSGGGSIDLGGVITLANTGVLSLTGGGGITVNTGVGAITLGSSATSANTMGAIVSRDVNGDFFAGKITATSFVGNGSALTGLTPRIDRQGGHLPGLTSNNTTTYKNLLEFTTKDMGEPGCYVINISAGYFGQTASNAQGTYAVSVNNIDVSTVAWKALNDQFNFALTVITNNVPAGSVINFRFKSLNAGTSVSVGDARLTIDGIPQSYVVE
jgi:hypothetical protein